MMNIRKPSDLSEEEMDKIIEENNFQVVADLINAVQYELWNNLIETGDIFNHSVSELFADLNNENTVLLMQRIGEIRFSDYADMDNDFHKKKDRWLEDYRQFYKMREIKNKPMPTTNTKQQLLLTHYLQEAGILNLNRIHQDQTKQAQVLSMLFGKGYDNVYKDLRKSTSTKYQPEFDKVEYLQPIYNLFLLLGLNEIADKIKIKIDSIHLNKKNKALFFN